MQTRSERAALRDRPGVATDDALARAVAYGGLSAGFQARSQSDRSFERPDPRIVAKALRRIARRGSPVTVEHAAARLDALTVLDAPARAASFVRLFGHTARGLVCACETEYGPDNPFHQPQQLANIAGYYLAFGLRPAAAAEARVDHIACELEFMGFLNRKHAMLLDVDRRSAEEAETLDATVRAERTFLRDHLGRFGRAFAVRVITQDPTGWFGAMAHVLLALLDAECARLRVEAGGLDLALRPEVPDVAPIACGAGDELIQIQRRPSCV